MNKPGRTTTVTGNVNSSNAGNHSQRGTNVPTQPSAPKMPAVKPNTAKK